MRAGKRSAQERANRIQLVSDSGSGRIDQRND
jgi:hypothetical protein